MKVGDLVMLAVHPHGGINRMGVIVDTLQKKCWRTNVQGKKINWDKVDPELHGVVLFEDSTLTLPATDLKVVK